MRTLKCCSYKEFIDLAYFCGHEAFAPIVSAFCQYHRSGTLNEALDVRFIETLSARLNKLGQSNDLLNAITLLAADMIYHDLGETTADCRWGSMIPDVVAQLSRADENSCAVRPSNHPIRNELVRFISLYLPHRISDYLAGYDLPESLPLINWMAEKIEAFGGSVSCVIGVQHLFGSTIPLVEALAAKGVPRKGFFLLGKPYSTSHPVYWALTKRDIFVHPGSFKYTGELEYHQEAVIHVEDLLLKAVNWLQSPSVDPTSRAIVLDDGGILIRKLHEPSFDHIRHRFACVEQTRRGITELQNTCLKIPVVNVAESEAKLLHESPIIAESIRNELFRILASLEVADIPVRKSALVIGFGSIGSNLAEAFHKEGWEIAVMDTDSVKRDAARNKGYVTYSDSRTALPRHQVIIGCTGHCAFVFEDIKYLQDGAILVSASSSDIEFSAWQMRSLATALSETERRVDCYNLIYQRVGDAEILLGDPDQPCHFLYIVRAFGRVVFLVHGGFPCNMPGSIDPIEPKKIQLTRCLMFAGAMQASMESRPGLLELNRDWQKEIIRKYKEKE